MPKGYISPGAMDIFGEFVYIEDINGEGFSGGSMLINLKALDDFKELIIRLYKKKEMIEIIDKKFISFLKDYAIKNLKIPTPPKWDNKWRFLGPALSMKIQEKIGADIIFAFDHITSPLDNFKYNKKAVELTDEWAKICLKKYNKNQLLFGIVQGGTYKDLRIKSAKSIGSLPFDGFGIGGSYTKKQISKMLKWIIPYLPEEKPRHLLGVGKVADIFEAVQNGIDTFDCVIPTREARHGRLYTKTGFMDIRRGAYLKDKKVIEKGCDCLTCSSKIPRSKIRELIKSDNINQNTAGQRWCLMHNMWFFNSLLEEIRVSISKGRFTEFKKKFISGFDR